jgi:eukaryotic-like serine/threonine-protein kinase
MSIPDEYPIASGDVLLGKYRVEKVLGRGAMGLVVAARHLTLDDRVAIKLLLPKCAQDAQMVQRFLREARAAVRIRSQHVVRVTDVGTLENGAPYMVMDHLEGKDLGAVLAESGWLPVPVAIDFVLQACEALAEAHAQGIVHRDVKPSNLFLTRHADGSPCVKVLDFGISKMTHAQDHALTRTGGVLGSPLYMSPEQIRSSKDVDGRADIYSTGVVLFELLTRRPPFLGEDLAQLIYKVMHDEPERPRSLRADIPEQVEHAILTAIARDRERRFPTIADFALALAPFAPSHKRASAERLFGALRAVPQAVAPQHGASVSFSPPHAFSPPQAEPSVAMTAPAAPRPLEGGTLTIAPVDTTDRELGSRAKRTTPIAVGIGVAVVSTGLILWRLSTPRPLSDAVEVHVADSAPQAATGESPVPPSAEPPASVEPAGSATAAPSASAEAGPAGSAATQLARPVRSAHPTRPSAPPVKRPKAADPFRRDIF